IVLSPTTTPGLSPDVLEVHGGGGDRDVLTLSESTDPNASTYTVTSSTIVRDSAFSLTYDAIDYLEIEGGANGVTYNVESTPANTLLILETTVTGDGSKRDAINVHGNTGPILVEDGGVNRLQVTVGQVFGSTFQVQGAVTIANPGPA